MATYPTMTVAYTFHRVPIFKTLVIGYGNKVEQRLSLDSAVRYRFEIIYTQNLLKVDADTIIAFFIARKGSYESFTFVDLESGSSYTVRFLEDMTQFGYFSHKLYNLQMVSLIEVSA